MVNMPPSMPDMEAMMSDEEAAAALAAKADTDHTHIIAQITGLQAELDAINGTISGYGTVVTKSTGVSAGQVPVLDGAGKLANSVLPAIAITDVFVVASQSAMLALTAERGDIAVRTDLNKSFALSTENPGTLADWKELLTPTDVVLSVAGLTGAISASALKTALNLTNAEVSAIANTLVGTVTIAESGITVSLGVRRVTVALAGAVVGGNYLAFATAALTAGYSIQDCICTTAGQITVGLLVPALVAGSYSFSLRIVRVNT